MLVVDGDLADLAVHLVEDFTLAGLVAKRADGEKLEDEHLALLQLDLELLADLGAVEEVLGRQHGQVAELVGELLEVLVDLGVHGVRGDVALGAAAELLLELLADGVEVEGLEVETGALVHLAALAEGLGAKRLGEAAVRLAHETLEELEH